MDSNHQDEGVKLMDSKHRPRHGARVLIAAGVLLGGLVVGGFASAERAGAAKPAGAPTVQLLKSGLQGTIGATIGPDGALYVAEGAIGQITRVDTTTGAATPFATGLPGRFPGVPLGGVMDVAFIGNKAYALVSVSPAKSGIYEVVNGTVGAEPIADLGQFSLDNPPDGRGFEYFVPTGVQFALQPVHGGFLVSDGHHNRILKATLGGVVSEELTLGNVVPTGLEMRGNHVYIAEVGPVPVVGQPLPIGHVVEFDRNPPRSVPRTSSDVNQVAAGSTMVIDVEFGQGGMYALSQGVPTVGIEPGDTSIPNTGRLLRVNGDGTFTVLVDGLNQPTSLDFVKDTAFVVGLQGQVWKIQL